MNVLAQDHYVNILSLSLGRVGHILHMCILLGPWMVNISRPSSNKEREP